MSFEVSGYIARDRGAYIIRINEGYDYVLEMSEMESLLDNTTETFDIYTTGASAMRSKGFFREPTGTARLSRSGKGANFFLNNKLHTVQVSNLALLHQGATKWCNVSTPVADH